MKRVYGCHYNYAQVVSFFSSANFNETSTSFLENPASLLEHSAIFIENSTIYNRILYLNTSKSTNELFTKTN